MTVGLSSGCLTSLSWAQQPGWRPSRISADSTAKPLHSPATQWGATASTAAAASSQQPAAAANTEQLGSGVVLRWKTTAPRSAASSANVQAATAFDAPTTQPAVAADPSLAAAHSTGNPLRVNSTVRRAAYQPPVESPFQDPFGEPPPRLPQGTAPQDALPALPGGTPELPSTPLPGTVDPLSRPEEAPQPGSVLELPNSPNAATPGQPQLEERSPFDRPKTPLGPALPQDELSAPQRRTGNASNFVSCDEQRDRVKSLPISNIDLDVSPNYGEGLRSVKKDTEQERQAFAESSKVREWRDYTGALVATGRLIDLRDDRVVLDVDGRERAILLRDLSDQDVAYVSDSWNIPTKCGTGYEPFEGRNFIASTVQWTASGLCHKPLYFEQVQLERYGHDAGPVVQPLLSTAHFFGNIGVLPYKMGIHPPQECQYALGYYRPGNCAPYMLQPIPLSLRGAAAQAGFVSGAAALIP